jgi:CRP/FNR family transcriptional regulator, cyclic AMP receptor protein
MYSSLQPRSNVNRLKGLDLFSHCSAKELRRIEMLMTETRVRAGGVLTSFAEPGAEFFVVIQGTATVWREGTRLETIGPGGFFGEHSLLVHGARTATVIADTDMNLFVLSPQEFRSPHFLIPHVMERMLEEMSERLRRADERWSCALVSLRSSDVLLRNRTRASVLP